MIIGHQKQWQFLKKSVRLEKFSHAYLFCGQEKLGKKTVAIEFAKLINGAELQAQKGDLILIEPEGKEIKIAQIRELIRKLSLKPYLAPFKTAIIDQAHLMTKDSQNSFLKTLEEPKGRTLLILITETPERLLPTIRSRCEIIKFSPVKEAEIKGYLRNEGLFEEECQELAKLCQGRPGEAIDFIKIPQKLENRKEIIQELIKISNSGLASRFQYAKDLSRNSNLKEILEIWLSYFRDVLLTAINTQQLTINNYSFFKLKNILGQIQNTNFLLTTTNINPRLALEILMLEL